MKRITVLTGEKRMGVRIVVESRAGIRYRVKDLTGSYSVEQQRIHNKRYRKIHETLTYVEAVEWIRSLQGVEL